MNDEIIWKNRIVSHGEKPAREFQPHELNARRHPTKQRESLVGSLNSFGWIAPVIISLYTGKLLDGHARIEEAMTKDPETLIPYIIVDVTESEEAGILAAFDPITALATYDREALDTLLCQVSTGDAALQTLFSDLAAQNGLYQEASDIKEFEEINEASNFIVKCESVAELQQCKRLLKTKANQIDFSQLRSLIGDSCAE